MYCYSHFHMEAVGASVLRQSANLLSVRTKSMICYNLGEATNPSFKPQRKGSVAVGLLLLHNDNHLKKKSPSHKYAVTVCYVLSHKSSSNLLGPVLFARLDILIGLVMCLSLSVLELNT